MLKSVLNQTIQNFLKNFVSPKDKLLLAFSGGPDSLALFHLLKDNQSNHSFTLALAHVDHGQRKESAQEAEMIQKMAQEEGIELHVKKIAPPKSENLENYFRQERLKFFSELCEKKGYDAVLLAHHRDDLNETVLKRFLEGVSFEKLAGMQTESFFNQVRFLRPLLTHSKTELLTWLDEKSLTYFVDATNADTAFLRARMRKELIPDLEKSFGKKIESSLSWMAKQSTGYLSYMKSQVEKKLPLYEGPFGFYVDARSKEVHPLEIQFLLKETLQSYGASFSRDQVEKITESLLSKRGVKAWPCHQKVFYTYQGYLFYVRSSKEPKPFELLIQPQEISHGHWSIHIERKGAENEAKLGWKHLFSPKPQFRLFLPEDMGYKLCFKSTWPERFYFNKRVSKWLLEHQVPAFLSPFLPYIEKEKALVGEFLSEKMPYSLPKKQLVVTLTHQKALK